MQLNETAARVDAQLENVCKKIERVEMETRAVRAQGQQAAANHGREEHHLTYKENYAGNGIPYRRYIESFSWDTHKFQVKRTLNELVIAI